MNKPLVLGVFDVDLIQAEAERELKRRLSVDELQCIALGGFIRRTEQDGLIWIPDKGNPWVKDGRPSSPEEPR